MAKMAWAQVLFTQGFGVRRACEGLVRSGQVRLAGTVVDDPAALVETAGLRFEAAGQPWTFQDKALVLLNKPAGYECSQKPKHHSSVYSLLPAPLRNREVQAVGRLDEDTTGLLLLTDDGQLIHKLTSPRHHVPKVYDLGCAEEVTDRQVKTLLEGVMLTDERTPVRAAGCEAMGVRQMRLTLSEGKYHQVKRMLAAVGNSVTTLHRSSFGALALPADLAPGQWRWLDGPQVLYGK